MKTWMRMAVLSLAVGLGLGGVVVPSAGAGTGGGMAVIVSPVEGSVYEGTFEDPIVVDLSQAGASDPAHQFDVWYRGSGGGNHIATLSGNAAHNEVSHGAWGPGTYEVWVDPTWLGDEYTVRTSFEVEPIGSAVIEPFHEATYEQGNVDMDVVLRGIPAGTVLRWSVRDTGACGGAGNPSCDPDASGDITASGASVQRVGLPLNGLPGDHYEARLYTNSPYYSWDSRYFTVLPKTKISSMSVSTDKFFPLVRDGYRDKVVTRFALSRAGDVVVKVARNGRTVRRASWNNLAAGNHKWTWNGTTNSGKKVEPGRYKITASVTSEAGTVDSVSRRVEVATTTIIRRGLIERRGTATEDRDRSAYCRFYGYSGELTLDCWGGRYARAEYKYRIPRSAFDLRLRVYGEAGCCDEGRIIKNGVRTGPRTYRSSVTVTRWRSYTVRWADLRYKYKVRR